MDDFATVLSEADLAIVLEVYAAGEDPIEGVWIGELDHLAPRAYVFTPFWGETADPALRKALETVLIDPEADVTEVMEQAAQEAQAALDHWGRGAQSCRPRPVNSPRTS